MSIVAHALHGASVPIDVLQRVTWNGTPKELGDLFRLTKNRREARAVLRTHQLGWEVWLLVGQQAGPVRSQVCRTQDEVVLPLSEPFGMGAG